MGEKRPPAQSRKSKGTGARTRKTAPGGGPTPAPPAAPAPKGRKEDGTFAPGTTGNPGGLSREHRELRRWCQEQGPTLRTKLEGWLGSDDFRKEKAALDFIAERGWGKAGKASELPDVEDFPVPAPEECGTAALLSQVRGLLARGVSSMQRRVERGEVGPEDMGRLGELGRSLGELLKVEKEAARASKLSELSVDELLDMVVQHVPADALRSALEKRDAAGMPAPPARANKEGPA